jgi:ABC-type transport system substrate-binding protein
VESTHQRRARRVGSLVALVVTFGLLGAACASSESGGGGGGGGGESTGTGPSSQAGPQPPVTQPSTGTPRAGGALVYGLEAETDGFNPTVNRWAISGTVVGLAVFDPLAALDAAGQAQPYLAQSMEPSADYKTWTVKLRPGITFHDGSPLTSAAVKKVYDEHKVSALTASSVTPIESVTTTDDLTAVFTMRSPWAVFPTALTGQIGVIPSPKMFDAEDKGGNAPVGTGPFVSGPRVFDQEFVVTKNPSYWRRDASGVSLPYLDRVVFQPVPEVKSRWNGLQAGQIDMIHTNDAPVIVSIRQEAAAGKVQKVEDKGEAEEGFVLLNMAAPPFDNPKARRAVALATDRDLYNETVSQGVLRVADGVFTPDSPWVVPTDYPDYDPAAARALVDEVKAETGTFAFKVAGGGNDTRDQLQLLQSMWQAVGMEVEVDIIDQAAFIPTAVLGQYQANLWRQFGAPDPDADYLWWVSENAEPIGTLSLNMARLRDPELDRGMNIGRENTDREKRKEGYAIVQRQMAAELPYIWLDHAQWVIAAKNDVRNLTNGPLPDGQESYPIGGAGFPGVQRLTHVWLDR